MNSQTSVDYTTSPLRPPRSNWPVEATGELLSLRDLIGIFRRHMFLLFGLPVAAAILGLYLALAQTPLFDATTLVQLDPRPSTIGNSTDLYDPGYNSSRYYFTQLRIIQSRKLAELLVNRLQLDDHPKFAGPAKIEASRLERWMAWLPGLPEAPPAQEVVSAERHRKAVDAVLKAASARLSPSTTLIEVHFTASDPKLAAQAANELADIYIEELLQARLDIYAKATNWISTKLGNVEADLSDAEDQLQKYRETRGLVNVGGNRTLIEQELSELSSRLREAQRLRTQLDSQNSEISRLSDNPSDLSQVQALLPDPVIKATVETLGTARARVKTLESRYGTRHPEYQAAKANLEEVERNYRNQIQIRAQAVGSELKIAQRDEQQLQARVDSVRKRLSQLDRDEFQISMLQRQVTSNKQLYDLFLSRFKEAETNSSFDETNARIADPAVPPAIPSSPKKLKFVVIAGASGFILAIMLVLLRVLLHTKIELPEELEALANIPVIGVIPSSPKNALKKSAIQYLQDEPRAAFSDAVRSVKAALLINHRPATDSPAKIVAVTSAEPSDGKTTLCAALSASLASGYRVLVLDADMRRPTLARHFGVHSGKGEGLSDLLSKDLSHDAVIRGSSFENLSFVTAGHPPANPAILLESDRLGDFLSTQKQHFDFILIDTPPLLAAGDALLLTQRVDGYVLVTRAEKTHKQAFIGMLKRLETVGAHPLGVILNGAPISRNAYAGYYYYGSTYKY